ncbi:MAG: four-carbon acid sugar kinase family protein [Anaerolineae bacterium]|nr:four-carbon acid sugar kinase family protein [Anaerolineae bacterium]
MPSILKSAALAHVPPEWPDNLLPEIQSRVMQAGVKIVVLDDDPTGNQTVYDVMVLTGWSIPSLCAVLVDPSPIVYILTNSRSASLAVAEQLNRDIAHNLRAARSLTGRDFVVVSRSDSTLRGHYPGEVNALMDALKIAYDGVLIIPFFPEGGRLTLGDIHYVTYGDMLVPAGETEYAHDPVFGYTQSDLRAWVSEKTGGMIAAADVFSISLEDIRTGGPKAVARKLASLTDGRVCVVNAVAYRDLEVFVAGLLRAEAQGKQFLYRTAASFVRVRGGLAPRPLLNRQDLINPPGAGLIIAGSYVNKTTQQLAAVQKLPDMEPIVVSAPALLESSSREGEIQRVAGNIEMALGAGSDVLLYTSRDIIQPSKEMSAIAIGHSISNALVSIVKSLQYHPAWLIAKGGITASDIATRGLGVRKATVLGQVLPGVPVWRTDEESRWSGLTYVVFPGNVGDANALADTVVLLRG